MEFPKTTRKQRSRKKFHGGEVMRRGVFFLPSLITTGSLFFGFVSIIRTFNGQHVEAAMAILIATIFDFFDGAVARLTKSASDFGEQYDSLSDLVSFGVAPACLAYSWALQPFGRFGWLAAFLLAACAALRLARFNVQAGDVEKYTFQGLPTPASAWLLAGWVLFHQEMATRQMLDPESKHLSIVLTVYGLAFLMVSNFRYRNLKKLSMKGGPFPYLVLAIVVFIIVASEPALFLFPMACIYAAHAPLEHFLRRLFRRPRLGAGGTTPVTTNGHTLEGSSGSGSKDLL